MNTTALSPRWLRLSFFLLLSVSALAHASSRDTPLAVIDWPATGTPTLRFTFSKFKQLPGMSNIRGYVMETSAQNLSTRVISSGRFSVYLYDKNKVRVGEDVISISNVGSGETVKFDTSVVASGMPVSVSISEVTQALKTITLTVNSAPQGAMLKMDGADLGITPRLITVGAGKHTLTFSKEGFTAGKFPLEISPNDVSGGTVSYELGASSFDSIEMRDGSVLNGDLVSMSGMDVEIRVAGNLEHIDRNKIKRIMLVQRDAPEPSLPPAVTSGP